MRRASLLAQLVKNLRAKQQTARSSDCPGFRFLGQEDSLEKEKAIHSSILAWKSHEQRSMAGYSPWGCKRDRHDLVTKQQQLTVCISQEIQNLMADRGILPLKSIAAKFFPVVYT